MLSSWGWLLLTDFAPFKPTYLPEDNPADYSYFFDTSRYLLNFLNSISIDCSCMDLDKSVEQPKRCFEVIFVRENYIPIHAIVIFSSKHNPLFERSKKRENKVCPKYVVIDSEFLIYAFDLSTCH